LHREGRVEYFQLLEIRRSVPPTLPDWRGVAEDPVLSQAQDIKGIVQSKKKSLSVFTHPSIVPTL